MIHGWTKKQATSRALEISDVDTELFQTILSKRHERISQMANCVYLDELEPLAKESVALLKMLGQFLDLPNACTADRIQKVYDHIQSWIAYEKNSFDLELRAAEVGFLSRALANVGDEEVTGLLERLKPWESDFDFSVDGPDAVARKKVILAMAVDAVAPRALRKIFAFFRNPGSVRRLHENDALRAYKYLLFNPTSPLWKNDAKGEFLAIIADGSKDSGTYLNVRTFLDLLVEGQRHGLGWFLREDFDAIFQDRELIAGIWRTVTSRTIQWRAQRELLEARSALIKGGVPEADLPLSPELEARRSHELKQLPSVTPT